MLLKINCRFINKISGCKHPKIKRTFFGLGPKICVKYMDYYASCIYYMPYKRPIGKPPPPQKFD